MAFYNGMAAELESLEHMYVHTYMSRDMIKPIK